MIISRIKRKILEKKWRKCNQNNFSYIVNNFDFEKCKCGRKTYAALNIIDFSPEDTKVEIGSYCSIANGTIFCLGGEHNINTISTYPFKSKLFGVPREAGSKGDIVVEDDVWIGENSLILSGVTIGRGSIVAAGSVVTKSIPPYTIWGGVPARFIKNRFNENLKQRLLSIDIGELFDSFTENDLDLVYSELNETVLDELLKKVRK